MYGDQTPAAESPPEPKMPPRPPLPTVDVYDPATGDAVEAPVRPVELLTVEDLDNLPEPTWLVDGWVPEHGVTTVYGKPGSFKSFLTLAWALHVASGTPWHGLDVVPGPVVYLSLEGGYGLRKRIEAWRTEFPDADLSNFRAAVAPMSLLEDATVTQVSRAISAAVGAPKFLVVDTVSRAMSGGDENSPADMGRLVAAVDAFVAQWQTSVVLVHHTGHSAGDRERGHSSLGGAVDSRIEVSRSGLSEHVEVTQRKAKDSEESAPIMLARRIVDLEGVDANGKARSSLVLDWIGHTPEAAPDNRQEQARTEVLDALRDASQPLSQNVLVNLITATLGSEGKREVVDRLVSEGKVIRRMKGRAKMHELPPAMRLPDSEQGAA